MALRLTMRHRAHKSHWTHSESIRAGAHLQEEAGGRAGSGVSLWGRRRVSDVCEGQPLVAVCEGSR